MRERERKRERKRVRVREREPASTTLYEHNSTQSGRYRTGRLAEIESVRAKTYKIRGVMLCRRTSHILFLIYFQVNECIDVPKEVCSVEQVNPKQVSVSSNFILQRCCSENKLGCLSLDSFSSLSDIVHVRPEDYH